MAEDERSAVGAWLTSQHITLAEVTALRDKLAMPVPAFTPDEQILIPKLSGEQALKALASVQSETLSAMKAKLLELGASEKGLEEVGLGSSVYQLN